MSAIKDKPQPRSFDIHWDIRDGIVYAKPTGQFLVSDWIAAFRQLMSLEQFKVGMPMISDENGAHRRMVDVDDMVKVRDFLEFEVGASPKPWLCAFVSTDPGMAGVAEFYDFLANHFPNRQPLNLVIKTFSTMSSAEEWVKASTPHADPNEWMSKSNWKN